MLPVCSAEKKSVDSNAMRPIQTIGRPPGAQKIGTGRSEIGRQIGLVPYSAA